MGVFGGVFNVDDAVAVVAEHDGADEDGADAACGDLAGELVDEEAVVFLHCLGEAFGDGQIDSFDGFGGDLSSALKVHGAGGLDAECDPDIHRIELTKKDVC